VGFAVTEIGAFGPHRALTFAEFSPDGLQVITAGWDNSARLWTPPAASRC
jgi:WD40 repeat protein